MFLKSIWTLNFNNTTNRILNAYQNSLLFKDVLKESKVKIFVMQIDILPQICCLVIFKVLHICNQSKYLKSKLMPLLRSDNCLLSNIQGEIYDDLLVTVV